uniref:Uncharacterized protein n=1 Tax=Aegilops tauschii subsp. strangulata TaxID=200361 RepID=A0A453MP96_AEGTS
QRPVREMLHLHVPLTPSSAPVPEPQLRLRPPASTRTSWRPPPQHAAAGRSGPSLRSGGAGAQVWSHHVPEDGYLRCGGGVVALGRTDVPEGALDERFTNLPPVASAEDISCGCRNMVFANYGPKWKLM